MYDANLVNIVWGSIRENLPEDILPDVACGLAEDLLGCSGGEFDIDLHPELLEDGRIGPPA